MNQPIDDEGMVHFTTTLFALIRENLVKIHVYFFGKIKIGPAI